MTGANEPTTITVDGRTRFCLTALVVLLTVLILGLWAAGPVGLSRQADAAARVGETDRTILPNAGAQRKAIIEAIKTTNGKLDRIARLLEGGKLRVTVVQTEPAKAAKGVGNVKKPAGK